MSRIIITLTKETEVKDVQYDKKVLYSQAFSSLEITNVVIFLNEMQERLETDTLPLGTPL